MQAGDEIPLFKWENSPANWEYGDTKKSFTQQEIIDFVSASQDIEKNCQIRFMICLIDIEKIIGCVDLFEYDKTNKIAGVGILIGEQEYRNRGFALESLQFLINYSISEIQLHKLFCNISPINTTSIRLFEKCGFKFIEEIELFNQKVNYYELEL